MHGHLHQCTKDCIYQVPMNLFLGIFILRDVFLTAIRCEGGIEKHTAFLVLHQP